MEAKQFASILFILKSKHRCFDYRNRLIGFLLGWSLMSPSGSLWDKAKRFQIPECQFASIFRSPHFSVTLSPFLICFWLSPSISKHTHIFKVKFFRFIPSKSVLTVKVAGSDLGMTGLIGATSAFRSISSWIANLVSLAVFRKTRLCRNSDNPIRRKMDANGCEMETGRGGVARYNVALKLQMIWPDKRICITVFVRIHWKYTNCLGE